MCCHFFVIVKFVKIFRGNPTTIFFSISYQNQPKYVHKYKFTNTEISGQNKQHCITGLNLELKQQQNNMIIILNNHLLMLLMKCWKAEPQLIWLLYNTKVALCKPDLIQSSWDFKCFIIKHFCRYSFTTLCNQTLGK